MLLDGKTAFITGGGRGIGRGVALAFAEAGCRVVVADNGSALDGSGSDDVASKVQQEVERAGGAALALAGDITDADAVRKMVQSAEERFGQIDILVNNAGISRPNWSWDLSIEDFRAVVNVHLIGQFTCIREMLPQMRERGYGRIINMTSGGALGYPLQAAYSAAKSGVIGMTYACAIELEGSGVTINAFAPRGLTRMSSRTIGMTEEAINSAPIKDAPFITYLASQEAAGVNGQVFHSHEVGSDGRGGFDLYQKSVPIAEMTRSGDDDWWTPADVAEAFGKVFSPHLVVPGRLSPERSHTYAEKVAAQHGLPGWSR
jgi:NAD(P)-dependent dehydrogenase (short-subunit alcohol dehydrogenase family)